LDFEDMTIPWIAFGPDIVPALSLSVPVSTTDTAAWALGLALPSEWDDRPVMEVFGRTEEEAGVRTTTANRCGP
jgi:hypothetical protein